VIEGLKPYAAYRDSGVPFLGDIPKHWSAVAVKREFDIQLGKMLQPSRSSPLDQPVRYLKAQHVQWFHVRNSDLPEMFAAPWEIDRYGVRPGDLLVCEGGEGGRSGIVSSVEDATIIQNALHRVRRRFSQTDTRYLLYVMAAVSSSGWFEALNNKATIAHFTAEKFGALRIPFPPVEEQAAIVRFLDHADRRIRRYIQAKQKLIKLLEEQKQAIIHRAVTRGLDPDVPLKPSGVEWLGDIPAHWEVKPAKWFYREVDERSASGQEELLSVSHITGVTPRSEKNITMFMAESYVGHKLCRRRDLVINTMWAWMGALGISRQSGIVSPGYHVYRPLFDQRFRPEYVDLLLRTRPYISEYICRSTGIQSSRLRLYPEEFLRIPLIAPLPDEQDAILSRVREETAEIESTTSLTHREIELVREYRTRLIADVVSGKLDVREAAARLPDSDEVEALDDADVEEVESLELETEPADADA
jgi:type I restriction enzyme S subunit